MANEEDIFLELIPEGDRAFYKPGTRKNGGEYKNEMQKAFQSLLNCTFDNLKDGKTLSVKDHLAMKTVGYCLANPTPQNVKVLCEMAGESTKVDVTSNGKGIDELLAGISINNGKNS